MRVLVVDDSGFMRRAISQILASEPGIEVLDTARNGAEAIQKIKALKPDVVTLDIEMPQMDGLAALQAIMKECPTPVVMCSSLTTEGSAAALKALKLGAVDCIAKDHSTVSFKMDEMRADLIAKVKAAAEARIPGRSRDARSTASPEDPLPALSPARVGLVVIGSSTGGPPVLETIIQALPRDLRTPVVIAQHMPLLFTKLFAKHLADTSAVHVVHAENGMPLREGTVHLLPGGTHGRVRSRAGRLHVETGDDPPGYFFKPSVDELMLSSADAAGDRTLGVMLTGIGNDGLKGARQIVARGGKLVTQAEATCVVYGMPKVVVDAGLSSARLTPERIAALLRTLRAGAVAA